jgi:hypothetical protein
MKCGKHVRSQRSRQTCIYLGWSAGFDASLSGNEIYDAHVMLPSLSSSAKARKILQSLLQPELYKSGGIVWYSVCEDARITLI